MSNFALIFKQLVFIISKEDQLDRVIKFRMQRKKIILVAKKQIQPYHTLLIEERNQISDKISICLTNGAAEIYGMQLKRNYPHFYSIPCSIPIFSWQGAEVKLQWTQYENVKNSSQNWVDVTEKSREKQSSSMLKYLDLHFNLTNQRKFALQECKIGPRVAIVGTDQTASNNIVKLLLNYSGKYGMNPYYVDIDPENSVFIDGSICALDFDYIVAQDLFDRPNKLCYFYGNRSIKSSSYFDQVKILSNALTKRINKQISQYKLHGTKEEFPMFANGLIIQFPRAKSNINKRDHALKIKSLLAVFDCTHLINVGFNELETLLNESKPSLQYIRGPLLENTDSFVSLPRPIKSKIERYFNNQSHQIICKIDDIKIYELMTQSLQSPKPYCRVVNIREEAISKNVISILHAKIDQVQKMNQYQIYSKALYSPIATLARIFGIGQNQITLQVINDSFLEQFQGNIWVTSVNDQ